MEESKSFNKGNSIVLYHGGYKPVEFPEVRKARFTKDFSWGFYTTNLKRQAEKWAKREESASVVSKYKYTENSNLKILKFEIMTEEWLDFIVDCRSGRVHTYDVVEGPMADDTIYNYIRDLINHVITREAFWVIVKFKYPTHQLSFHTLASLDCLEFIESYEVDKNGI